MDNWKQLSELISNSHKIILTTHIDPDGDGPVSYTHLRAHET